MGIRKSRLLGLLGLLVLTIASAAPLTAQRGSKFMEDFRFAMSKKDRQLQDDAMKKFQLEAVVAIIETCQEISDGSSAILESEMAALAGSWRRVHKTEFADAQYKYFSLMKSSVRNARANLLERYLKVEKQYLASYASKKKRAFPGHGIEFHGMSEEFKKLGDRYMAAVSAYNYGLCFSEELLGDDADLKRACEGYGMVVKLREQLGLKDATYQKAKTVFDELEFQGFGDPNKGPEARKRAKAEKDPAYKATPLETHFEVAPNFKSVARPNYGADSIYQAWHTINLRQEGSVGKLSQLGDLSPNVLRQAAAKVSMDSDGDGKGDTPIAVNGNINVVECSLGKGDSARKWAFQAVTGSSQDTMQGIQPFNLAPDEKNMTIYVAPAASLVGMIAETRIQIIDDNMDGLYGSEPKAWELLGLRKGESQKEVDSIIIGKSKRALPWSEQIKIGEHWYGIYARGNSSEISFNRVDVETGTIKLELKGVKAQYMLVQGTGNNKALCFDIASNKKGVEVPAGTYALLSGLVSKGKRDSKSKALVQAGASMELLRVKAGETLVLKMGAPFGFDFDFSQTAKDVTVYGSQIAITGNGGETYQRLYNCRTQPEVSMRKAGGKKGSKGEKMKIPSNQNDLGAAGYKSLWGPFDGVFEKKTEDKMEVQLFEKKNKLFGKITSEWNEG